MTKLTLIIGNKNYSSWSLRPWVFMKQHQIEFDEIRIPLFTDKTREALEPYSSDYKVPILQVDTVDEKYEVWDTLSILEYLSETYLQSRGWPASVKARAIARSISCEMHSSYFNMRSELPMNCRKSFRNIKLSPAAKREIDRIKSLWRQCRTEFGANGEWLFGDYSIADAMFAPVALRFAGYNIPLDSMEQAYVNSVLQQAYIIEWIEAGKAEKEIIEEDEIDA